MCAQAPRFFKSKKRERATFACRLRRNVRTCHASIDQPLLLRQPNLPGSLCCTAAPARSDPRTHRRGKCKGRAAAQQPRGTEDVVVKHFPEYFPIVAKTVRKGMIWPWPWTTSIAPALPTTTSNRETSSTATPEVLSSSTSASAATAPRRRSMFTRRARLGTYRLSSSQNQTPVEASPAASGPWRLCNFLYSNYSRSRKPLNEGSPLSSVRKIQAAAKRGEAMTRWLGHVDHARRLLAREVLMRTWTPSSTR